MLQPDNSVENTSHTEVSNNLRPVFYASKTLTATESNYSNIERERFTRFIVVKKCADLSAHSAILSLLEVFCEHGVPSNIRSDRGRNFVSKEFDTFCKDLGIVLNFSSGYHHSANQAEHAVRTVKDLMKRCDSAGVHWCIALLEFLCTPGPDSISPSDLMGRQFHGILPMIDKVTNNTYSDEFLDRKDKEKEKFDMKHSR